MKIAMIPWDGNIRQDSIYQNKQSEDIDWHIQFAKAFAKAGHEFHTIDVFDDISKVDWFLFFTLDFSWMDRVIKCGKEKRMIYLNGEPPVVKPENSLEGYRKLLNVFAFIMTWNDDLVDGKRIFKRCIPYLFKKRYGTENFKERKLLVNISGNKHSPHPKELYSERERVITWFEENTEDEFDLYGTGWNHREHPSYRGIAGEKSDVYHHYRFALCLENTYQMRGYLTEKLFDCFVSGIVPIYLGASDIDEYVPKSCYIDYSAFSTIGELYRFLADMTETEYQSYLSEIDALLDTNIQDKFTGTLLAEQIMAILDPAKIPPALSVSGHDRRKIALLARRQEYQRLIMKEKKFIKQLLRISDR